MRSSPPARSRSSPGSRRRPRTSSWASTRTTSSSPPATSWLTSRRIDGQFPNYKQLLPETFEIEIAIPASALLEVVRRAGLMAQRNAPLRLRFAEGELTVSAQTQDIGEATESLPIDYAGEELEIGFNPDFLRDGLEAVAARHRPAQAHQPPATRAHRSARRELLVPDHAHPPRGLIVREVTLRDFRSYAALELDLEPGVVLLHGPNGAGKTNLLEALHVGTQGFSPRARRDAQMVRFGADAGRIALAGSRGDGAFETDVVLTASRGAASQLNGDRSCSVERLRHELTTLVFTPDRLAVVKGAPGDPPCVHRPRRRAPVSRTRDAAGRVRECRRAAQRSTPPDPRGSVRHARPSFRGRSEWRRSAPSSSRSARDVGGLLAAAFAELAGELGLESAALAYEGEPATDAELDARLDADLERGLTGAGPHLHDVRIEAGGRDLRVFGSQGEQRRRRARARHVGGRAACESDADVSARAPRRRALGARRGPADARSPR